MYFELLSRTCLRSSVTCGTVMPLKSIRNALVALPIAASSSEIASALSSRFMLVSLLRLRFGDSRVDHDRGAHRGRDVDRADVFAFRRGRLRFADRVDDRRGVVAKLVGGKLD